MGQTDSSNFSAVTERPGIKASAEQLSMLFTRYKWAAQFCKGKQVFEAACGSGLGLGFLAKEAKQVIGGDIEEKNLQPARELYRDRKNIELRQLDAQTLPFGTHSLDVVILFEAIYYFPDPEGFLRECRRVLRPDGILLICSVNCEWADFNPSPFSVRYFSSRELSGLLRSAGFDSQVLVSFPVRYLTARDRLTSQIKRMAVKWKLVPKTMKGKEFLKRIFFGKLFPLPLEVTEGMAPYQAPVPLGSEEQTAQFKVLYVSGRPQAG